MKIALAANENHMESKVAPHFGRCNWYCIFNTETQTNEFVENTARHHNEKAGCESVNFLSGKGISIAIAGRFGSMVAEAFRANKIQMVVPEGEKTIEEIINQIK